MNTLTHKLIQLALEEDAAQKDITSQLLFHPQQTATAGIFCKENGILCGTKIAELIFKKTDPKCKIQIHAKDGQKIKPGQKIMTITGKISKLLAAERTVINFLQHLSGISTLAGKFVDAVRGTHAIILDTRKTMPGMRHLEKYAVRCGRAQNHRMNLSEMAMVKDNHLKSIGSNRLSVIGLKAKLPKGTTLLIEAENMKQVQLALNAKADIIMLDNMPIPQLKKAIHMIQLSTLNSQLSTQIEVTGGITLKNVRQIAKLGPDRISVGAMTHSAPALDISMEIVK